MADQNAPAPPPGFDTVVAAPPPPAGFDTVVGGGQPPAAQPSLFHRMVDPYVEGAKGFVKEGEKTAAGLTDLASAYLSGGVAGPGVPTLPIQTSPGGPTQQAFNTAATWLRKNTNLTNAPQKEGAIAEAVLEFMALPQGEEAKLAGEIPGIADSFTSAGKLIKTLQGDTKLARVFRVGLDALKTGTRAGLEQGQQTLVKTGGDVEQAKEAATTGAVIGGAMGGGGTAIRETREALQKLRPGTRTIAGAEFPTLATGELYHPPGSPNAASAATDEATGNIAKTAVANSLNRSNAARPVGAPQITDPARMLPGRAGFEVETTPPREVGTPPRTATVTEQTGTRTVPNPEYEEPGGTLTREPGQTAEQTAQEIGPGATTATPERAYAGPEPIDTRNAAQRRIDAAQGRVPERMILPPKTVEEPVFQQRPVVTQEGTQTLGGGGTVRLSGTPPVSEIRTQQGNLVRPAILTSDGQALSVEGARAQQARYNRILNDPDLVDEMGVRQHRQMVDANADLSEQLRRYDDHAASQPNFPPHDAVAAVRNTDSLATAGKLLKDAHSPFWEKGGDEWRTLRKEEQFLEKKMQNPTGSFDELQQQLQENQQKQMDFFDRHRTELSPQEWEYHRAGYQDGIVVSNLNNFMERQFNGITRAEAAQTGGKLQRIFKPTANFNQQLEDFYNTGANREVLERTIGKDHMLDLKELGQLFENGDNKVAAKNIMDSIGSAIRRHHWGVGGLAGGGLAYGLTHLVGGPAALLGGAAAAGTVTGVLNHVTDRLMTDPDYAKSFIYATKNKVAPRIAGPLLASRLLQSAATEKMKEPKQQGAK
jgi:hypothetical protein